MDSLEKKQEFLRREILEAGFNPGEFLQFLESSNPKKGTDLQLWEIQQLQQIVTTFKNSKSPENVKQVKENEQTASELVTLKTSAITLDDNYYKDNVKCQVKEPNKLQGQNLNVKVVKFQKVEGGTFQRSYVIYTVQIPTLKLVVNRRYSDFVWLRQILGMMNPGYPLPPIAKKGNFKRYDDKYLTKKMLILEKFLNVIINISQVKSQLLFEKFITITDQKQFEKYKAHFSKFSAVPITKIKTLSGTVLVGTDRDITNEVTKYNQYLKLTQPQIKKIYKNFKGAATCLQGASQFLTTIAANCKFLRVKDQGIRYEFGLQPTGNNNPFAVLETFTVDYASQLVLQAKTFRKEIYSLMKYESLYKLNMLEVMEQLNVKQQEYNSAKASLLKKKEKLYLEGKMDKWGLETKLNTKPSKQEAFQIMLPKDTKQLLSIRQNYGFYNAQTHQQIYRSTKDSYRIMTTNLRQFISTQFTIATNTALKFQQISLRLKQTYNYFSQC